MHVTALEYLKTDPIMGQLIERVGPIELAPRRLPPFQSIAHAIIYQQLSGKAASTILKRFQALFGDGTFPSPQAVLEIDRAKLLGAGLSRPKAGYILDLSQRAAAGGIPSLEECDSLSDDELIERFTEIKGVGRWTVEMMLIFNFGRPDVLPIHDLGVRRGYQVAYRKRSLPEPERLQRLGKKWAPYRTTAALYLWRAVDAAGGGDW